MAYQKHSNYDSSSDFKNNLYVSQQKHSLENLPRDFSGAFQGQYDTADASDGRSFTAIGPTSKHQLKSDVLSVPHHQHQSDSIPVLQNEQKYYYVTEKHSNDVTEYARDLAFAKDTEFTKWEDIVTTSSSCCQTLNWLYILYYFASKNLT